MFNQAQLGFLIDILKNVWHLLNIVWANIMHFFLTNHLNILNGVLCITFSTKQYDKYYYSHFSDLENSKLPLSLTEIPDCD